jgi:hypothetical protein
LCVVFLSLSVGQCIVLRLLIALNVLVLFYSGNDPLDIEHDSDSFVF